MALTIHTNQLAGAVSNRVARNFALLQESTRRLSSGLRINTAADDAAGLAIRELQRCDISALHQGARNANDAISMIQTADGALSVIDEKLVRMKELAEQAATGTYNETQRAMINNEFQEMAREIQRIATATDFNGIKLLDGSLSGVHRGDKLMSTGAMKIHFGTGNDSAEDYYYADIGDCTLVGLGLATRAKGNAARYGDMEALSMKQGATNGGFSDTDISGIAFVGYIPAGSKNVRIFLDGISGDEDDIQIFTRDGYHLAGTSPVDDPSWHNNGVGGIADANFYIQDPTLGFLDNATTYKLPGAPNETGGPVLQGAFNDGLEPGVTAATWSHTGGKTVTFTRVGETVGTKIRYSGDFDKLEPGQYRNDGFVYDAPNPLGEPFTPGGAYETLTIDEASEDLLLATTGRGLFKINVTWDEMPGADGDLMIANIATQEAAQKMLPRIDQAIVLKDNVRAHLGALQNRLENTVTNLNIQAENLQAAESRISDIDVADEMTRFVRNQILAQSSVAMLTQANSLPQMAMQLIQG